MYNKLLFFIIFTLSFYSGFSQVIEVNPNGADESAMPLKDLIETVFLGESCASVSNITTSAYESVQYLNSNYEAIEGQKSFAYFTNSGANFPINRGVILSSGAATASQGPNNIETFTGLAPNEDWDGDADLKLILDNRFGDQQPTSNATIVEFDFIPVDNTFNFDYVFASEEYDVHNFECSEVQDGFVFILSGPGVTNDPGISGKNIALLPDGVTPVSSGTIHNNTEHCDPAQNPNLYITLANGTAASNSPIQYNGRTVKLTASHPVTPGESYHMKMVIADRGDNAYDSAVFLKASASPISVNVGDDITVCSSDFPQTLTATGTFSGNETYVWLLNGSVISGANNNTYSATQPGTYEVQVVDGSHCAKDNIVISINDSLTANATANSSVCAGNDVVFTITGPATSVITYNINAGTNQTINLNSSGSTQVTVSAPTADVTLNLIQLSLANCIQSLSNSITVDVKESPQVNDLSDQIHCGSYTLPTITGANLTGNEKYYSASSGGGTSYLGGTTINYADFNSYPVTLYIYDATGTSPNCTDEESFQLTINVSPNLNNVSNQVHCDSYILPEISGEHLTGNEKYYTATNGGGTSYSSGTTLNYSDFSSYPITLYIFDATGTDPNCTDEENFQLTLNPSPIINDLEDQMACVSFTLPEISGTHLSGNEMYYIGSGGSGTSYAPGTTLNYSNFNSYPVTLYAYDASGTSPNCIDEESFQLTISQLPAINTPANPYQECDEGEIDGFTPFNLVSQDNAITGGNSNYAVTYHLTLADAQASANALTSPFTNTVANNQTIHVRVTNTTTMCYTIVPLNLIVSSAPQGFPLGQAFESCDPDNDGFSDFDLSSIIGQLTGNNQNVDVAFYVTLAQAESGDNSIPTLGPVYTNVDTTNQTIYAQLSVNGLNCTTIIPIDLLVLNTPILNPQDPYPIALCDDNDNDTNLTDGLTTFDLTASINDLLAGEYEATDNTAVDYDVNFYETYDSASDILSDPITNDTAYNNTSNPQIIYVEVINTGDEGNAGQGSQCRSVKALTLEVSIPPITEFKKLVLCDDDYYLLSTDMPQQTFDLTLFETMITSETGNTFSYFLSEANAEANTNAIDNTTAFENTVNPQDIYIRVQNVAGCYTVQLVEIKVNPNPTPLEADDLADLFPNNVSVESCLNNPADNPPGTLEQGYAQFDLTEYEDDVIGGETLVSATYYTSETDANLEQNPIANPTEFYNTIAFGQTIWIRVTNTGNVATNTAATGCYTLTHFNIRVPVPQVTVTSTTDVLCVDESGVPLPNVALPVLTASATNLAETTAADAYTYQWFFNGVEIPGATSQSYTVNQPGDYTVIASGPTDMMCKNSASATISISASPATYNATVTTNAFANNHVIEATATSSVPGVTFEYSLDDPDGPYQSSGTFTDVNPGPHIIYIRDVLGCATVQYSVFIIDYPKFFSPNNDGANDTWMIYGIDNIPISQIYIFDRFGKLLKQLDPDGAGWDGTYNGHTMPSTDYWFKIIYIENNQQKEFRAHFSLKR